MNYSVEEEFLKKVVVDSYKSQIKNKKFSVEDKQNVGFNSDYVTSCDVNTEKYIIEKIKRKFPNDHVVSEEFNSNSKCEGRCWVIDPIDGTANFMRDIPYWCTQVAFVVDGNIKLSAIYNPEFKEFYFANQSGAYLNGYKLEVNKNVDIKNSIFLMCDFESKINGIFNFQSQLVCEVGKKCSKVKMLGSAGNDFSMVASGQAQAYLVAIVRNNIWDLFPGKFLCEKAGCEIFEDELFGKKVVCACANIDLKNLVEKNLKKYKKSFEKAKK